MCSADPLILEVVRWVMTALAGFGGVVLGAWLTGRRQRTERRLAFIEKQLHEFYSPLVGLKNDILTHRRLSDDITKEGNKIWQEERPGQVLDLARERRLQNGLDKNEEYNKRQFNEDLFPCYQKMWEIFRDKYYLAEEETRGCFSKLLEFVEMCKRRSDGTLPVGVSNDLGQQEKELKPFFEHLQQKHDELRARWKNGKP